MRIQYFPLLVLLQIFVACSGEQGPTDAEKLGYFKETYESNREAFRQLCARMKDQRAEASTLNVPSRSDKDLTIDLCYFPPATPGGKLVIITSGIHGIEAFASSAIQRFFMDRLLGKLNRADLGILLVHGVNPFGFRHERRVTENNVDLNRNFDETPALFQTKNEGYSKINSLLNPTEQANPGNLSNRFFPLRAIYNIVMHSMAALRQAALQGQYEYPKGIYFGGSDFEPQKEILSPRFLQVASSYRAIMLIDIHTGYGARGKLHFFPNAIKDAATRKRIETVYAGYQVDYGDTKDFYTTTGDFSEYLGKLLKGKEYIPMVFEFGTLDSQTTSGSIKSIHNMILENQGYHYGFDSDESKAEVRRRFREHFYPSSSVWRTQVLTTSEEVFPLILERFSSL
ncbi:MAG: DUF2817 domain-containing protein [Leptospirales bacterium]|nr:DUF2817 domain-containing protein [Leptospirales bacterium]